MNKRKYSKTELGMMYGVLAGAVVGLLMFSLTNDAWWFSAVGFGVALGLGIGASMDRSER